MTEWVTAFARPLGRRTDPAVRFAIAGPRGGTVGAIEMDLPECEALVRDLAHAISNIEEAEAKR